MKKCFCENNETATITLFLKDNPITLKTSNPPICIGYGEAYVQWFLTNTLTGESIPVLRSPESEFLSAFRKSIYAFVDGGTIGIISPSGNIYYSFFYDPNTPERVYQFPVYEFTRSTVLQKNVYVSSSDFYYVKPVESFPRYEVKCDGCEPGECKGANSKYPGYICLDCKEIQSRLNNIGRKIDGITK